MCGINGFISKKKLLDISSRIDKMNCSLAHRGPDADGVYISQDKTLALGQRRLAIIDLDERSNQPFHLKGSDDILVFNGEIYNYKELKKYIEYEFTTQSDTEVLAVGIQNFGIEWIKKCNGMFSFCYYNSNEKSMVLCRDRLGIKPLYYYAKDDVFVFSSEIKGILNSGLVKAEFNEDAIDEYLGNRYVREPYTFFKNIFQLPAGHYMTVSHDMKININKYWQLPSNFNRNSNFNEDDIYIKFKKELNKAIERRMVADVTVGTYLSGGIDSSLISAVASTITNEPINTYTIGFPELNEFDYARLVADRYQTNHHEIVMDETNYLEMMEEIIKYKDSPLGVPNEIPLAQMSKVLKKDITVVLSGEGADELMGGYGRIFRSPFDFENIDRGADDNFYSYFINKYEYVPRYIRDKYLKVNHPLRNKFDDIVSKEFDDKDNEENVFRFFHKYHVKGLLQRVDITTMYASVEARVPFLDHELIEFCYQYVPYDLKLRWNTEKDRELAQTQAAKSYSERLDKPKYLLRKYALELLPEIVVTRKKTGFPVPLNNWLIELEQLAKKILINSTWLKKETLSDLFSDCMENERSGQLLWMFLNVEIFRKLYFEREWRY